MESVAESDSVPEDVVKPYRDAAIRDGQFACTVLSVYPGAVSVVECVIQSYTLWAVAASCAGQ